MSGDHSPLPPKPPKILEVFEEGKRSPKSLGTGCQYVSAWRGAVPDTCRMGP